MIKIVKKGTIKPKNINWYKVKCPSCGCEFYATEDEFDNVMVCKCLQSDPLWRPPSGTIRCPNEDCHLHEDTESFKCELSEVLSLPEGEEPIIIGDLKKVAKEGEKIIYEKLGIDTEEKETAVSLTAKDKTIDGYVY